LKNATASRTVSTTGNLDTSGATVMGIDSAGMQVVLDTLSNLYSNRELAVVREYSCNARDAHVQSGQTKPVEVTLPSPLVPQLKVRDYGTGLSRDEVVRVYAQYGASTKRDSNKMIGAFGIGSKSAFSVSDNFTVTAVKDGELTVALFSMTSMGPTVNVLIHTFDSTEPNGVTVEVPVQNTAAVAEAARVLFQAWQPGTVLVDNRPVPSIWKNAEEIVQGVFMDISDEQNFNTQGQKFRIVMGGVPYNVPTSLWNELSAELRNFVSRSNQHQVTYLFDVKIGAVDITPSREELKVTPHTVATIRRNLELLRNSIGPWMTTKLDAAPSLWEAARVFTMLSKKLGHEPSSSQTYWNGVSLGSATVVTQHPAYSLYKMGRYSSKYRVETSPTRQFYITSDHDDTLIVTGVTDDKQQSIVKRHAKIMINEFENGQYKVIATHTDSSMDAGWFSFGVKGKPTGIKSMTYDEYRDAALATRKAMAGIGTASSPRSKTVYDVYVLRADGLSFESLDLTADEINARKGTKLYVPQRTRFDLHSQFVKDASKDVTFVYLTGSKKWEPLEKNVPGITPATAHFHNVARALVDGMTPAEADVFKMEDWADQSRHQAMNWLVKHKSRLTNKGLLKLVDSYEGAKQPTKAQQDRMRTLRDAHAMLNLKTPKSDKASLVDELKVKLPLLVATMHNTWQAENALGGRANVAEALLSYVNTMPY
jgi:hypothetical protein